MLALGAASPTTAPADSQYASLIHQLGDEDFTVREDASAQLLAAGDAVKPALELAARDTDPEISSRARALLDRLSIPPLPGEAPPGVPAPRVLTYRSGLIGDVRVIDLQMNGRTTHIEQGPNGVKMTVTGYLNGQVVTHDYKAADAQGLKEQSPDAYALWEQIGGETGRMTFPNGLRLNGGNLIINGGNVVIGPPPMPAAPAPPTDDIDKLTQDISRQMQTAKLTNEQRNQVLEQLHQVRLAKEAATGAIAPADSEKQEAAFLAACDDLRKELAVAGLADPGAELPPPASSRLGISIDSMPTVMGGVHINTVQADSRGEKMGLQPNDFILSVNGKPVTSTTDLRTLVMANKHLVLSVYRTGQTITLTEPAAQ
jgi:hypothetical protein